MRKIRKIRKRCACGCKKITNYGKKWVKGHHSFGNTNTLGYKHSEEAEAKMSLAWQHRVVSEETKRKMSEAKEGKKHFLGHKHSEESKLKMSLANIKYDPNNPWR
jgi:outer membrane protein assembly factor BamA